MNQTVSNVAILSILFAVGSFFATFSHHSILGFIAAVIALPLGIIGLIKAASPRVRGGIISITAITIASFGALVAVIIGFSRILF